jgi:hypothetical protein
MEDFQDEQRKLWPIGQSVNSNSGVLIEEFLHERLPQQSPRGWPQRRALASHPRVNHP